MSPPSMSRSAAVAALALALAACGEGTSKSGAKREIAPVPMPATKKEPAKEPMKEPAPDDAYSKGTASKEAAPKETAPQEAMPKAPSTGDPPVPAPADAANAAHREFQDAIAARLKSVDEQITALAAKVKAAAEDQKESLQKTFDDLSVKRDEAANQLDQIRIIAADKWDTAKADLEKSVGALESAAAEALK
jgi:hypothetical protein